MNYEPIMDAALHLATRGWGRVSPNPLVGAVVCAPDGATLAEGWHEGPGTEHAEVMALRVAGARAAGATLVCTLEPCDRTGRTPPCSRAIIDARIGHVVVAASDPNLGPNAPGFAALRAAGIQVTTGVREEASRRLNAAFERHVRTGRPFVVMKSAITLDGRTAAADGSSKWITSAEARLDAHHLRAWADAVVIGSGTALEDDPALTVRGTDPLARPPLRVLVDARGRVGVDRKMFDSDAPTLVATTDQAPQVLMDSWAAAGAEVMVLGPGAAGGVDLTALLAALGKRDVQGVVVEGGATLAWSLLRDGLVDRLITYVAPRLVGGVAAPGMVAGEGFTPINAAMRFAFTAVTRVGPDLKVEADVHRDR